MNASFDKTLNSLNPGQLAAVKSLDGPLLVSAGAGSGKTRVLTYRIAYLIAKKKALPHQILAVTFTNKAAYEMQERAKTLIQQLAVPILGKMWISTFHSMCARILKDAKGLIHPGSTTFTIYDNTDQLSVIKKNMKDLNINEYIYNPKILAKGIALSKRKGLGPEDINPNNFSAFGNRFQDLYFLYEEELKKAGAFDFEGLLLETYKLFLKHPEELEKYRNQLLYISVDEYQDTNHIQYLLIKTLAKNHRNICVVGDEDQSIYSWRGADISNILSFDKDFPECKIVKLEQNYRSTKTIISAASALINNNCLRQGKTLFTKNPTGQIIQLYEQEDEYGEAHTISNIINEKCQTQDSSYEDFAIFYRTNAQSRVLEDSLRSSNIPYKMVGNLKFYDRLEVKDILAYLKFISNPQDEVSLKRILNSPKRGIGANTINNIAQQSLRLEKSFYETMKYLSETNQIKGQAGPGVLEFLRTIEHLKSIKNTMSLTEFYKEVMEQTKYTKALKDSDSVENMSRIENLQELGNVINQFEMENETTSLETFLEEMTLLNPSEDFSADTSSVTLMTIHVSKGLEFNTVFITGLEDGLFPLYQNTEDNDGIEEERRLAYVGMTRAKKNLFISYATKRSKFGKLQYNKPSQFLNEIPKQFIQFTSLAKKKKNRFTRHNHSYKKRNWSPYNQEVSYSHQKMYKVGQWVHHPRFGNGKIQKIEGSGDDLKVSVLFQNKQVKKFIAKYAYLS